MARITADEKTAKAERVEAVLAADPDIPLWELSRQAGCSTRTAQDYLRWLGYILVRVRRWEADGRRHCFIPVSLLGESGAIPEISAVRDGSRFVGYTLSIPVNGDRR